MIYVSAATETDMQRILDIEQDSISPPWPHGALLSEIYCEDSFFAVARRVAENSGASRVHDILGFVILRRAADEGELFQIAVDKTARRRGIADMLMGAALEYVSGCGLTSVYLELRASNEAAACLYEKHGFVRLRSRKNYYTDPAEDALVMVRYCIAAKSVV